MRRTGLDETLVTPSSPFLRTSGTSNATRPSRRAGRPDWKSCRSSTSPPRSRTAWSGTTGGASWSTISAGDVRRYGARRGGSGLDRRNQGALLFRRQPARRKGLGRPHHHLAGRSVCRRVRRGSSGRLRGIGRSAFSRGGGEEATVRPDLDGRADRARRQTQTLPTDADDGRGDLARFDAV